MTLHFKPFGGSMARALLLLGISLGALGTVAQAQSIPLTSGPVLPLYRALRNVGLDPQRVFQIREAEINREDIHIWLNHGTLAFPQSVDGQVTGAFFDGAGEVVVRPPDRLLSDTATPEIDAVALHDALPTSLRRLSLT